MTLSEIEEKVKSLRETKELSSGEALSRANEITGEISKVIKVQLKKQNYKALERLYEMAAETYLLAAEKVPKEDRDSVSFPADYWSTRATQARLKLNGMLDDLLSEDFSKIDPIASAIKEMPDLDKQYYLNEIILKLKDKKDPDVRRRAVVALGRVGGTIAVEQLVNALGDDNEIARWRAEEALGRMGESAVEPLIGALKNEKSIVRGAAAKVLGIIGSAKAIEPLTGALKEEMNPYTRSIIKDALDKIKAKQKEAP